MRANEAAPADGIDAVPTHSLLGRAQELWEELAHAPGAFVPHTVRVIVSPDAGLCPPGWGGVVALGGSAVVTVPSERTAAAVRTALSDLPAAALTDPASVSAVLPVTGILGPATLAYASPEGFRPAVDASSAVERLPADHPALRLLEEEAGRSDSAEASLGEITSSAFVVRERGRVVAAAGHRTWPCRTAHISVLTAPGSRGRGLARTAASAVVAEALSAELLPQWRARSPASRRVAAALGFEELGTQLSFALS
ncbi:GNAT family N-acetyltransferase [Streptomyces sp. NPDC058872]|uniref:GNAT family N-acetyltransferase n=1 Tax=Streptomyces sp. NPDC058872 TaxID=3346661 RepID=UPI00369ED6F4